MRYCDRCGIESPEAGHECSQPADRYCPHCGAAKRRIDGLCQECVDKHLDAVTPLADDLMGTNQDGWSEGVVAACAECDYTGLPELRTYDGNESDWTCPRCKSPYTAAPKTA
ncbi:MAG: hypothetical protein GY700_10050 [Propionibacteriaceae bacterium]|nr:hypothetical protein [Propionibacteriaceae bacterium]